MSKYKVIINWYGELHTFWTTTTSNAKAEYNATTKLAKRLGINRYRCRQYFYGKQNAITIKEII